MTKWKLQPSVIIGGLNGFSNLCLAMAIAEGVAISWWRKALKGATVAELHQSWAFSMSFSNILSHFWRLDAIALAALAAKLAIVDGILFQRASTTYTTQDPAQNVTLLGAAAKTFPQTGYVVAEGFGAQTDCNCFMIGDTYTPTVDTWETSNGLLQKFRPALPILQWHLLQLCGCCRLRDRLPKEFQPHELCNRRIEAYDSSGGKGDTSKWTNCPSSTVLSA